jgi:Flp pilus assembly protein TadG
MRTTTITRVTAMLLALSAAGCTAQAQGSVDTRTASQFDDYNPAIKPPVDSYDMGGAAANKNALTQYSQGGA